MKTFGVKPKKYIKYKIKGGKDKAQHLMFGCNGSHPDIITVQKKSGIIVTTITRPWFKWIRVLNRVLRITDSQVGFLCHSVLSSSKSPLEDAPLLPCAVLVSGTVLKSFEGVGEGFMSVKLVSSLSKSSFASPE